MEKSVIYILAGFIDGIILSLVGFVEKFNRFKPSSFVINILIASIVGADVGALENTESQVSFLAGYAGTDFIENLYRIKLLKNNGV